jgi:hypothetical protein
LTGLDGSVVFTIFSRPFYTKPFYFLLFQQQRIEMQIRIWLAGSRKRKRKELFLLKD